MNVHIVRGKLNIPFLSKAKLFAGISFALIGASVLSLAIHGGPRWGIDFTGGTVIELRFAEGGMTMGDLRTAVSAMGFPDADLQHLPADVPIYRVRTKKAQGGESEGEIEAVKEKFVQRFGEKTIDKVDSVGPRVGAELRRKGWIAFLVANIGILLYISFRFEFQYALGAIAALFHDAILTVGAFSFLDKEISLEIVAALLTIIGYSVNDTIVIFDRVRENVKKYRKLPLREVIDLSVNETLSRTLLTSIVTFYAVVALLILGGGVVRDFAFAMTIGMVAGTYSTVFIASPIVILWEEKIAGRFLRKK